MVRHRRHWLISIRLLSLILRTALRTGNCFWWIILVYVSLEWLCNEAALTFRYAPCLDSKSYYDGAGYEQRWCYMPRSLQLPRQTWIKPLRLTPLTWLSSGTAANCFWAALWNSWIDSNYFFIHLLTLLFSSIHRLVEPLFPLSKKFQLVIVW